jgi:hypothetical protein
MAEIVESGFGGQTGALQQRLERAHDVAVREWRADGAGEYQPMICPEPGLLQLLL